MRQNKIKLIQAALASGAGRLFHHIATVYPKAAVLASLSVLMLAGTNAFAEDCFNGPVHVEDANRAKVLVPPGRYLRMQFTFNASWENVIFVCDAITGRQLFVKGNYSRDRTEWTSPVDATRTLAYYIVAFHKLRSPLAHDAGSYPWINSPMKAFPTVTVPGQSGSFVDVYGFNDGGGNSWDNAMVTAYFVGGPGALSLNSTTIQSLRPRLR